MPDTTATPWDNHNKAIHPDFEGLTPNEMHALLYDPFGEDSVVKLNQKLSDTALDQIPYFRLTETLFEIIARTGKLKLTSATNSLPVKVIQELYGKRFILDYFVEKGLSKMRTEQNSVVFTTLNITTRFSKFIKLTLGVLTFTKAGKAWLVKKDRNELLRDMLQTFTEKLNWAVNDGYPEMPIGQLGWAYSIFLLLKFGEEIKPISFYSQKYFQAFPSFAERYPPEKYLTGEAGCHNCYTTRVVDRFLEWFGLVEVADCKSTFYKKDASMQATELLNEVFRVQR